MNFRSRTLGMALLLAVTMAAVSMLPTQIKHALHTQGSLHPWLHFGGFALLALLLLGAFRHPAVRLLLLGALLLFGYSTEAGESHADGWPIERRDVQLDAAGVLSGALLAHLLSRRGPGQAHRPA